MPTHGQVLKQQLDEEWAEINARRLAAHQAVEREYRTSSADYLTRRRLMAAILGPAIGLSAQPPAVSQK